VTPISVPALSKDVNDQEELKMTIKKVELKDARESRAAAAFGPQ